MFSALKNRLYDSSKIDSDNKLFSNKALWVLLFPIIIEQLLNSFMGMADTMMVSNVGSSAISAVSLVDSINVLVIQVFSAMATGATIICSQFLGRGDERRTNKAARQVVLTMVVISVTLTILLISCRSWLLSFIFGQVESEVMADAKVYF